MHQTVRVFWQKLEPILRQDNPPTVVGSVYKTVKGFSPGEIAGLEQCRWFNGQSIREPRYRTKFCTGGWWAAQTEFLRCWDYPFPYLDHNGGDVLLGELVRQRGGRLHQFRDGIAINADKSGRESKAPRRGVTTPRPWQADHTVNHGFQFRIETCSP